jgi:hypothetical protein
MSRRPFVPLIVLLAFSGYSALTLAQAPPRPAPRPASQADRLPVRRVVLYKSGVGYFEHLGRVRGNQTVTIDFTSGQLDDVLKSLTTLDLDGGRVSGVSYNTETALDRKLGALRLPLGEQATRAQLLSALRGSRVEIDASGVRTIGRLLSVERMDRRTSGGTVTQVDTLSVVSDAGRIQTIALDPGVAVRIAEADLNQEVGRYLALVASERDQDVRRLSIATAGTGDRDLFVSYVSEVPVWKATYRIVLPASTDAGQPLLQGWAIVDNTVGEDWNGVALSLVAGAPQSFIQQMSRPYYVQRPIVPLPAQMLLAPQTHQAALGTTGPGVLTGTVTDPGGRAIHGAIVSVTRSGADITAATTDAAGRYRLTELPPAVYDANVLMAGFAPLSRSGVNVSGGMETILNATLVPAAARASAIDGVAVVPAPSVAPMQAPREVVSNVTAGRTGAGYGAGVSARIDAVRQTSEIDTTASQLGDLFEYTLKEPVTIRKNQSALVPILGGSVIAEKVSLWNGSTGSTRPLRAVSLTNTTGLTLDGGSFTVVDGQAYAGEGLMESLKAGERRLLSYAIDLGLVVDAKSQPSATRVTRVEIAHGLLIQHAEEKQQRTYTIRNEDTEPRALIIEHPARPGWDITGTISPIETTPAWIRFQVPVPPKTTTTFVVDEARRLPTQFAVSSITGPQVALLVRDQAITAATEAALREVLARKIAIADLATAMSARKSEIDEIGHNEERLRENMQALKGSAAEKQLLQRYVSQLNDQETRLETARQELQALTGRQQGAQADLDRFIAALAM